MSLKETLKSLSKQGQIAGTLAIGGLTASTNASEAEPTSSSPSLVEVVEKSFSEGINMASNLMPLPQTSQAKQQSLNILFDKEMWTFDFQRGVDNLVHDFFQASPFQMQPVPEKKENTDSQYTNSHDDLMGIFSIDSSQQQEQEIKKALDSIDTNALAEEVERGKGTLYQQLQQLRSGNGHFSQAQYKAGKAMTLDMYKGDGGRMNLGMAANIYNAVRPFGSPLPYVSDETVNTLSRFDVGVKHSGTDTSNDSYRKHLRDHAISAFLPPNVETIRSLIDTADSVFNSEHRATRLVGGYELDNGGKLAVSFGSVPIMEEFSSRGMVGPNEAHLMRDRFNVDQRVKNAVCFDYITPQGDMHRLGYAEHGGKGTIFSYDGSNGEVFYVGSKNALEDKLQFAGGVRASTALDGFEGFGSVRYNPNDNTQAMFEVHGIGTNDPRCVASIQHDTNNFVFGVMAAANKREQALYGTVEHKDSGWYAAAGAERIEKPSGEKQTGFSIGIGKKWTFGGR